MVVVMPMAASIARDRGVGVMGVATMAITGVPAYMLGRMAMALVRVETAEASSVQTDTKPVRRQECRHK
jgi:hypothetical protein